MEFSTTHFRHPIKIKVEKKQQEKEIRLTSIRTTEKCMEKEICKKYVDEGEEAKKKVRKTYSALYLTPCLSLSLSLSLSQ